MLVMGRERRAFWVTALAVGSVTLPACCALSTTGIGNKRTARCASQARLSARVLLACYFKLIQHIGGIMATWPEVRDVVERLLKTERWNDETLCATISLVGGQPGSSNAGEETYEERQVYIRRSVVPAKGQGGGFELVAIDAPLGPVGDLDLMSVIGHAGQLPGALLGYAQGGNGGMLTLGTRLPADLIDLNEPARFLMTAYLIADCARGAVRELGTSNGPYAHRAEEIRQSAWQRVRQSVLQDDQFTVEKDYGNGFILGVTGPSQRHRVFAAQNDRGLLGHYVTFEYALGAIQDVDMQRAVGAASSTLGGVVCDDGFVTLRLSQPLTALTCLTFSASIADLIGAAEEYMRSRRQST
jgi:hypothetical protein